MQYSSELQRRVLAKSNYLIVLPSNNSLLGLHLQPSPVKRLVDSPYSFLKYEKERESIRV